jgi:diketogulonate reductase-like aldo/keto reductase
MMKPEGVRTAAEMSLGLLQMDQIDVLMINWPMAFQDTEGRMFPVDDWGNLAFSDEDYLTTWKAMEELVDDELVRSLGVCNFNSAQLDRLMQHCDVKPLVNQVECHPWLNQAELLAECRKRQVALQGYAPLGSPDRPWREEDEELLIADATVCRIASKHGCPPAHILLKFQIDRGIPVITKTRLESRVQDYQQALRFKLEREDWDALMQLDRGENGRLFAFQEAADHPHYPFKQPALGIASIIVDYQ